MKNIDTCPAYRYEEHPTAHLQCKRNPLSELLFLTFALLIGFLLCAGTAYFILIPIRSGLAVLHAPSNASQRTLSFEERVSYQRAIEDVYWRRRIWPKERPDPKPSLEAVMSQAQREKKVQDYLRNSQALQDYWQRPITAEQLQAEMDRMAKHTRQPEVLQELFEALGNDPFIIAECLARPALARNVIRSLETSQQADRGINDLFDSSHIGRKRFATYALPQLAITSNTEGTCIDNTWTATSLTNAPSPRETHSAVWTGSEMIVWGGSGVNTGGRYNPSTDTWTVTSTTNAPTGRAAHTAVWTGSEMIIWAELIRPTFSTPAEGTTPTLTVGRLQARPMHRRSEISTR